MVGRARRPPGAPTRRGPPTSPPPESTRHRRAPASSSAPTEGPPDGERSMSRAVCTASPAEKSNDDQNSRGNFALKSRKPTNESTHTALPTEPRPRRSRATTAITAPGKNTRAVTPAGMIQGNPTPRRMVSFSIASFRSARQPGRESQPSDRSRPQGGERAARAVRQSPASSSLSGLMAPSSACAANGCFIGRRFRENMCPRWRL